MTTKEIGEAANLSASAHGLLREDSTPESFLAALQKRELYEDAVSFWAHKLTAADGVKWALACIRELESPEQKTRKNESLVAADRWVLAPGDDTRWAAKEAADKATDTTPADILAHGIFLSGGSVTPPQSPEVQPPPYAAQKLISGSVRVTVLTHEPQNATARYKRALALGRTQ
jgi:phosphopantetheinyl transferase (holo-ACP synthase)